jgi:hypothetical protein
MEERKIKSYENKIEALNKRIEILSENNKLNEAVINDLKKDANEYKKLQDRLLRLNCIKDGDYDEVKAFDDINNLYLKIDKLIRNELSPIQYEDCLRFINKSEYITDSFLNMVNTVQKWCDDMTSKLDINNKNNIINVEDMR